MRDQLRSVIVLGVAGLVAVAGTALANATLASIRGGDPLLDRPETYSLWSGSAAPTTVTDPDRRSVELGVKFKSDQDGTVLGVRFYKSATNTGVHTGSLWTMTGTRLATAEFTNETASGWQYVALSKPVGIKANVLYVVSYHTDVGHYSADDNYFRAGRDRGPLHAPADGVAGTNGVYAYGAGGFPNQGDRATNYWVDVVFTSRTTTHPGSPTPQPTATSASPTATATRPPTARPTPSPTRSATSSPPAPDGSGCPAFPAFPDASCTGWQHTGVKLHTENCPARMTRPNTTYDSCLFTDGVSIAADNVTIKRSRVEGRIDPAATDGNLRGLTLVDVEVDGGREPDFNQSAIGNSNYSCTRCDIHSTGRGVNMGSNVTIRDSYIHDFVYSEGAHQTAVGAHGGDNYTIVHNNLQCNSNNYGCSAALSFYGDDSQINGALVQNNLFNTDGGYCTYAGSLNGKPYPHGINIRYLDNRFGKKFNPRCGGYGPVASYEQNPGNVWRGNAWQDGSGVVTS
ncbi:DUF4082 domain-containing protein [Micromonospora sp. NPDC047548]|uniref:DUF4082 domain-containing protein n=1 Tax=Micromonospora sp. NPDC047548 TaxID=3155624 RepID=UPI0033F643F1